MSPLFKESPEFHKLLTDGDRPRLAKMALEIARDAYPELDFDRYLALEGIAERVQALFVAGSKPQKVLGQINWAFFRRGGLRG